MKIEDIFDVYVNSSKSINLSENDIYSLIEEKKEYIPVISSKTTEKGIIGFIPKPMINIKSYKKNTFINIDGIDYFINVEGSLTVTTRGYSGVMFYRSQKDYPIYAISGNCYIFSKKINVNLEWFISKFQHLFTKHNKKGKNNQFNKLLYNKFNLHIPNKTIVDREFENYKKLENIKSSIFEYKNKINELTDKNIEFKTNGTFILREVFGYTGRNDGLTEASIYNLQPSYNSEKISILSGGGDIIGYIDKKTKTIPTLSSGKIVQRKLNFSQNKPIYCLITRGNAGSIILYKKGNYAGNTNSYPLFIKDDMKNILNIHNEEEEFEYLFLVKNIVEEKFKSFVTSNQLSVFPMAEVLSKKEVEIELPYYTKELQNIVRKIIKLKEKELYLCEKLNIIDNLLKKDLI